MQRLDDAVDQSRIIGRKQSERIAYGVFEVALPDIEFEVPGLFCRTGFVEPRAGMKYRFGRIVARAAALSGYRGNRAIPHGRGRHGRWRFDRRSLVVELLIKRLERAGGLLAAGNAEIEPLLLLQKDCIGVIFAVVAALPAVLLPHGCHHAPAQRTVLGERQALGERHRRIVPGSLAVVAVFERPFRDRRKLRDQRRVGFRRQRRRASGKLEKACKKAVEPGTLFRSKGRALRNQIRNGRPRELAHSTASLSNMAFKESTSCRRVNAKKVSASLSRCTRNALSMRSTTLGASSAFTS